MNVRFVFDEEIFEGKKEMTLKKKIKREQKISDLIHQIFLENKKRLEKEKVKENCLVIVSGGTYVSSDVTLEGAKITPDQAIDVRIIPRTVENFGDFGINVTEFVDMDKYSGSTEMTPNGRWSKKGRKWRVMGRGMSIECECTNENCDWFKKFQIITLRFGKFDVIEIFATTHCRKCKERINFQKINKFGFTKCKYKFRCVTPEYTIVKSKDWIKVPGKPCWLEGEIRGQGSKKYTKIEFIVERDNS